MDTSENPDYKIEGAYDGEVGSIPLHGIILGDKVFRRHDGPSCARRCVSIRRHKAGNAIIDRDEVLPASAAVPHASATALVPSLRAAPGDGLHPQVDCRPPGEGRLAVRP